MTDNEINLSYDEETGAWKALPAPYALIEIWTKSEFEKIIKALEFYTKEYPNETINFQVTFLDE